MTIEKLKSGSYRIKLQEKGKRYSITVPFKPKDDIEAYKLIRQKIDNPVNKYDAYTFSEACDEYIKIKSKVLSPSTIRGYSSLKNHLPHTLNNALLKDIDQVFIQKIINDYSSDHSPKTVRNLHGFISAVLTTFNPSMVLYTTLPQNTVKERYMPSESDVKKVLEYVKGTRYWIPYSLACLSLRKSEICALDIKDLSNDNILTINKAKVQNSNGQWIIKDTTKNITSSRTIVLPDELATAIRQQGYIYNGNPNKLSDHLYFVCDKLNIERFSLHAFRHFFSSYAHSLGYDDASIQKMGGWKSDIMKRTYRHAMDIDDKKKSVSNDIGKLF